MGNTTKLWEMRRIASDYSSLSPTLPPPRSLPAQSYPSSVPKTSTSYSLSNGYARPAPSSASVPRPSYYSSYPFGNMGSPLHSDDWAGNIKFRPSPFFNIVEPLVQTIILGSMCRKASLSSRSLDPEHFPANI
jgi:hypothetical protein